MKKILYLTLILNTFCAFATNNTEEIELASRAWEPNYFAMFFGLFLVIGLVYLTAYLYQKLLRIKIDETSKIEDCAKIISTTPLGQNKNLHVVKIKDEYILLGSTQNSITHIKDLESFEEKDGYYN